MNKLLLLMVLAWITPVAANPLISQAPKDAQVYFIEPQDGAVLPQTFTVKFGLINMGVAPAGSNHKNTGHHHLLVNTDLKTLNMAMPLPATDQIKHFGGGQTEAQVTLAPGKHSLQLLLGNYAHVPHVAPVVSEPITVTVK